MPNKGNENLSETVPKENNLTRNVETQAVEMAAVETSPESDPPDTSTPGGVIILPLTSCPVTPLNIHPENKKVETGFETPTSHSDTHTDKNDQVETTKTDHVETTTTTKSSQLKTNIVLNKCAVKLTKLSKEDVKRLCRQKPISKSIPKTAPAAGVETHYRTRSSMRPKTKHDNRLPHSVSSNVSYEQEGNLSSEDDKSPVAKKRIKLCPKRELSSAQIKADNFVTKPPPVTPLRRSARNIAPKPDAKPAATPDPAPNPPAAHTPRTEQHNKRQSK